MKKHTDKEFIDKAIIVHGNKYDYSTVKYINSKTKVIICCREHGEFEQTPIDHTQGCGCPLCGSVRASIKRTQSFGEFCSKAIAYHGNVYGYILHTRGYCNKIRTPIVCKEHGVFYQRISDHINGAGCPKCKGVSISNAVSSNTTSFVDKSKIIHGDRYIYDENED